MHVRAHMYTCFYDSIGNHTLHIPQHCPETVHPPPFFFFSFLEFNFVPTHCPLSLCVLFFLKKLGNQRPFALHRSPRCVRKVFCAAHVVSDVSEPVQACRRRLRHNGRVPSWLPHQPGGCTHQASTRMAAAQRCVEAHRATIVVGHAIVCASKTPTVGTESVAADPREETRREAAAKTEDAVAAGAVTQEDDRPASGDAAAYTVTAAASSRIAAKENKAKESSAAEAAKSEDPTSTGRARRHPAPNANPDTPTPASNCVGCSTTPCCSPAQRSQTAPRARAYAGRV